MGVNSLPKTVTRQRRDCDLNPGPTAPESSTLTTRLPSHPSIGSIMYFIPRRILKLTHHEEHRTGDGVLIFAVALFVIYHQYAPKNAKLNNIRLL